MLYCVVCFGEGGGGVHKRLSRMLCCIVLYVCGGGGEGCISDYQGCYDVLCCMFGGCISDYQGCYDVLCCMFWEGGGGGGA